MQGVLITPVDPDSVRIDELTARGTPVVVVDRTQSRPATCSVAVDDVLGGRLAIEHLVDLGHRRVGFVGGPTQLGQVADRLAGAGQAWAEAGRDPGDLSVLATDALTLAQGRSAGERLAGISRRRRPTAVFCANDLLALGLLQHVIGSGAKVPDDLAIVGYDDIDFAGAAAVPLTSVRQPRHLLGAKAAELVLAEGADPSHRHEQVRFEPELVARASTSRPRAT